MTASNLHSVLPQCRVEIDNITKSQDKIETKIDEIHEVFYKNGLVTTVSKNSENLKELKSQLVWLQRLMATTLLGVAIELIVTVVKASGTP